MSRLFCHRSFLHKAAGNNDEIIFKVGGCVKDDEMGVTYKINGPAKGSLAVEIISSC